MAISKEQLLEDSASWVKYRRWKKVSSSNVLAIHYDKQDKVLSIQFKGAAKGIKYPIYVYSGVSSGTAREFYLAGSKGKFVWSRIRDKYPTSGPM